VDNYNPAHKDALDAILLGRPGVRGVRMFGYPGYKVNGKAFAFVGGDGIALKLPPARVQALIREGRGQRFEVAEGIVWKGWLSIDRADSDGYEDDTDLLDESITYVAQG
jgi:hypothetical protein